ncbi:MAG: hypothetical protein ACYDCI_05815 [Candidatus Limnocylindrales bacterium]
MAISDEPWGQFSAADYPTAAAYCSACLIDTNEPGQDKTKGGCHLPVHEPDGDLNRNGIHAAAARLAGAGGGVKVSPQAKKAAARKLVALYQLVLKEKPPASIATLARS